MEPNNMQAQHSSTHEEKHVTTQATFKREKGQWQWYLVE
jgi:hypothetical protein